MLPDALQLTSNEITGEEAHGLRAGLVGSVEDVRPGLEDEQLSSLRLFQLARVFWVELDRKLEAELSFRTLELMQQGFVGVEPELVSAAAISYIDELQPEKLWFFNCLRVENVIQQDVSLILGLKKKTEYRSVNSIDCSE